MSDRLTDNQIKSAATDLALKVSRKSLQDQIDYYNKPGVIQTYAQLDDLYVHQIALKFKT